MTVGIANFKVNDTGLDKELVSNYFESELLRGKFIQVRERKAIQKILEHLERCQTGLVACQDSAYPDLKTLDIIVFGEFFKGKEGYALHVRAVSEKTWTVLFANDFSGNNHEELMKNLADELLDSLKVLQTKGKELAAKSVQDKYRVSIYSITNANAQAQKVKIAHKLDSILISAFGKKGKFQIVESSRIQDLKNEKNLAMSGLVQTNRKAIEARGITHYLVGSLKVFDEVRVLSYQIVNVKTGLPIITDMVEWTDEKEMKTAMLEVAKQSETTVFEINGKLVIEACDLSNVIITIEDKKKGSLSNELGICPLEVEDIPKGTYTLVFRHEERDTLSMEVVIKSQETARYKMIKMPPIDMSAYFKAGALEAEKKYQVAINKYQEFYKHYPRHRMAAYALYREGFITQIYLKKYEAGRKILEMVIKRRPDIEIRTEAYYGLALGYRQKGDATSGNNIFKMLINEYPGSTAAEAAKLCLSSGKCSI
jgi:TolA-binding protein